VSLIKHLSKEVCTYAIQITHVWNTHGLDLPYPQESLLLTSSIPFGKSCSYSYMRLANPFRPINWHEAHKAVSDKVYTSRKIYYRSSQFPAETGYCIFEFRYRRYKQSSSLYRQSYPILEIGCPYYSRAKSDMNRLHSFRRIRFRIYSAQLHLGSHSIPSSSQFVSFNPVLLMAIIAQCRRTQVIARIIYK